MEMEKSNAINAAAEFCEIMEIPGYEEQDLTQQEVLYKTVKFLNQELSETMDAIEEQNNAEIVDGFGDIAFVALNGIYKTFRSLGNTQDEARVKTAEVMDRICAANLGKIQPDGTIKRIHGKVQKPEGWTPPQYDDII